METTIGSNASSGSKSLIVLLCDTPAPPVLAQYGTYHDIFCALFVASIPAESTASLNVKSYDVVAGSYPPPAELDEADGVLLTGSKHTAYDTAPWILKLVDYVKEVHEKGKKIIGICFGHQIVAMAFGKREDSSVCESNGAWEVGVVDCEMTDWGKAVFKENKGCLVSKIQQMHRDHVPKAPAGFQLLAHSPVAPNQGMILLSSPTSPTSFDLQSVRIFTVQGHPEFTCDIVQKIVGVRREQGIFSEERAEKAMKDAADAHDGVVIGKVILRMLGIEA
ncbi:class I glutamine amidotransferase-like protein [Atractiella rhizophila]|nr:class I glutamine amidotransferase-like protein [Atractiella rhizophila]KAH8921810.1 class I glutamine amidotransferase-like protein [Atractiella rhizophila]